MSEPSLLKRARFTVAPPLRKARRRSSIPSMDPARLPDELFVNILSFLELVSFDAVADWHLSKAWSHLLHNSPIRMIIKVFGSLLPLQKSRHSKTGPIVTPLTFNVFGLMSHYRLLQTITFEGEFLMYPLVSLMTSGHIVFSKLQTITFRNISPNSLTDLISMLPTLDKLSHALPALQHICTAEGNVTQHTLQYLPLLMQEYPNIAFNGQYATKCLSCNHPAIVIEQCDAPVCLLRGMGQPLCVDHLDLVDCTDCSQRTTAGARARFSRLGMHAACAVHSAKFDHEEDCVECKLLVKWRDFKCAACAIYRTWCEKCKRWRCCHQSEGKEWRCISNSKDNVCYTCRCIRRRAISRSSGSAPAVDAKADVFPLVPSVLSVAARERCQNPDASHRPLCDDACFVQIDDKAASKTWEKCTVSSCGLHTDRKVHNVECKLCPGEASYPLCRRHRLTHECASCTKTFCDGNSGSSRCSRCLSFLCASCAQDICNHCLDLLNIKSGSWQAKVYASHAHALSEYMPDCTPFGASLSGQGHAGFTVNASRRSVANLTVLSHSRDQTHHYCTTTMRQCMLDFIPSAYVRDVNALMFEWLVVGKRDTLPCHHVYALSGRELATILSRPPSGGGDSNEEIGAVMVDKLGALEGKHLLEPDFQLELFPCGRDWTQRIYVPSFIKKSSSVSLDHFKPRARDLPVVPFVPVVPFASSTRSFVQAARLPDKFNGCYLYDQCTDAATAERMCGILLSVICKTPLDHFKTFQEQDELDAMRAKYLKRLRLHSSYSKEECELQSMLTSVAPLTIDEQQYYLSLQDSTKSLGDFLAVQHQLIATRKRLLQM